jgi:predicted transcriptional regulator
MKLKENTKTKIVDGKYLKEHVSRVIVRNGGIPKFMVKYIIDDLIKLGLVKRLKFNEYELLESDYDKKIKQLMTYY